VELDVPIPCTSEGNFVHYTLHEILSDSEEEEEEEEEEDPNVPSRNRRRNLNDALSLEDGVLTVNVNGVEWDNDFSHTFNYALVSNEVSTPLQFTVFEC